MPRDDIDYDALVADWPELDAATRDVLASLLRRTEPSTDTAADQAA